MPFSRTTARQILVELQDGRRFLVVQVEVNCPDCGLGLMTIQGHHLQALKRIIDEAIADHPELTQVDDLTILRQTRFEGRAPGDPTSN